MNILEKLSTPPVVTTIPCPDGFPFGIFHRIILHGPYQYEMELEGKMEGMLADDEDELLQCCRGPIDFQMDNHMSQLRDVELDPFKHGLIVRILGGRKEGTEQERG